MEEIDPCTSSKTIYGPFGSFLIISLTSPAEESPNICSISPLDTISLFITMVLTFCGELDQVISDVDYFLHEEVTAPCCQKFSWRKIWWIHTCIAAHEVDYKIDPVTFFYLCGINWNVYHVLVLSFLCSDVINGPVWCIFVNYLL